MALAENEGTKDPANPLANELVIDPPGGETPPAGNTPTDPPAGDADLVIVTIGEEAPPSDEAEAAAPAWVKELRKTNRDLAKELKELKQKQAPAAQQAAMMPKPTLATCDYDEEAYETKLQAWQEQQAQARTQQQSKEAAAQKEQDAWQAKLATHDTAKAALKVDDYEEAEAVASETLSVTQRGIIVSGSDNSALVVYALGKNPAKAKELASITDPVKFAFAIARLESQLKVTPKKAAPPPEKRIGGNAAAGGAVDSKLTSLEAEAERTGDRSKIIAYNREQRRKQA